jgi:hypothetical protein
MIPASHLKTRIDVAWGVLFRACESSRELSGWLDEAEATALKQEAQHRAMGARFTQGQASYRVSKSYAARCIIIGHVFRGYGGEGDNKPPESWADAASIRHDCALAYAIREKLSPETLGLLENAAAIDYAGDVAR